VVPFFCKQWPPTIMIWTRPLQSARLAEVELVVPRAGTLANGAVRSVRLEIQLKWYCTRGASAAAAMGFEGGPGLATASDAQWADGMWLRVAGRRLALRGRPSVWASRRGVPASPAASPIAGRGTFP
jgi:hypothetical protein